MPCSRFVSLCAVLALSLSAGCSGCDPKKDPPPVTPQQCADGLMNGDETAVDCGGTACGACADGLACVAATDCTSAFCNPSNVCSTPTCTDTWKNGTETDVDCGGTTCDGTGFKCAIGLSCVGAADCTSGYCDPSTHTCALQCVGDGVTCPTDGSACCSGYCDPAANQCRTCSSNGTSCSLASDCCTDNCTGAPLKCQPPATCTIDGQACPAPADGICCSGYCNPSTDLCRTCKLNEVTCAFNSDCCSDYCTPEKKCATAPTCKEIGFTCTLDSNCCDQYCHPVDHVCATPVSGGCLDAGATCPGATPCCSGSCEAGSCTSTAFCKTPGAACADPAECCLLSCAGGVCGGELCRSIGASCGAPTECCSGVCTGSLCAALPTANGTCTTLGNSCTAGTECCSTNCQGGKCIPAYTCNTYGDICYRDQDCCSGMCDAVAPAPGRCIAPSGGCKQDGVPCSGPTNCCTRICKDLGSGVSVCQPASGCRMTGDYCDKTQACCGGSPDLADPEGYGVFCDTEGTSPPPDYDPSTKNDYTCSNGQACNPPGNICGGGGATNASQNCCAGKGKVCKQDLNGIWRCFGGGSIQCPTGYSGSNDPPCCIEAGTGQANVCQFRDQCCNFVPCVPGADGVLRCTTPPACTAALQPCEGPDDGSCCPGTVCGPYMDGYACVADVGCFDLGAACTVASDCCSNNCDGGRCAAPCSTSGACTAGECCSGYTCEIVPGDTVGQCVAESQCSQTNQSCVAVSTCCDPAAICTGGGCTIPTCSGQLESCDTSGSRNCCTDASPALSCVDSDGTTCAAGDTTCVCDSCASSGQVCATSADCCLGLSCDDTFHCTACGRVGELCTDQTGCCTTLGCSSQNYVMCETDPDACTCDACVPVTADPLDPASPSCTPGGAPCCGSSSMCGKDDDGNPSTWPYECVPGDTGCVCIATG